MQQVIGYCRVSSARQVSNGVSLEAQQEKIYAFAALKGIAKENVVIYTDAGISGAANKRHKRVQLDAALAAVQEGDYLVSYSLSRLARDVAHLTGIAKLVQDKNANLVLITDSLDTSTASGRLLFTIMAGIAQFESEVAAERIQSVKQTKRDKGEKLGGKPAYGFQSVKNENDKAILIPDDGEQAVIDCARQLRQAGLSYQKIANELNKRGYVNRAGNGHYIMSVKRMLDTRNTLVLQVA